MSSTMRTLAGIALLLVGACATGQPDITTDRGSTTKVSGMGVLSEVEQGRVAEVIDTSFSVPIAKLWGVLPDVYEELGIPLGVIDTRAMAVGNQQYTVRRQVAGKRLSTYLRCGQGTFGNDNADSFTVTMDLLTQVVARSPTTTTLRTRIQARAVREGMSEAPVMCGTTGELEKRIAFLARTRVAN